MNSDFILNNTDSFNNNKNDAAAPLFFSRSLRFRNYVNLEKQKSIKERE